MANYVFENMSQTQAANFTSDDNLFFLSATAAGLTVSHNTGGGLLGEGTIISSGTKTLTFQSDQLMQASLATPGNGNVVFLNGDNLVTGTVGGEALFVPVAGAQDSGALLFGFEGADTITGSVASDTVDGGAGDDVINGVSAADDTLGDVYQGGLGADTITGGDGNDHIYGATTGAGLAGDVADSLSGGDGNDYIQGNAGDDIISGDDGNDKLYGGAGNDTVTGGIGLDYIQGNKGNDLLSGGDDNDTIRGGGDSDTLMGEAGADSLQGDAGNDVLDGGTENDVLYGGAGVDSLYGGAGNDLLDGGDGADTVAGGTGLDVVSGGAGNDIFDFTGTTDASGFTVVSGTYTTDEVFDYVDGADEFRLGFSVAAVLTQSGASFSTVGAARIQAQQLIDGTTSGGSEVVAIAVGSDTYLFYGAGTPGDATTIDSIIKVDNTATSVFTAADFN